MAEVPAPKDEGSLDAKTRLILAGERLFAEGGIQGVSMREIASSAGQSNHFAVQYHFGSREGLVQAIFDFRMEQMEQQRGEMLARLEREGLMRDARSILEIVMLPQLHLDGGANTSYGNFLSQYLLGREWGDFGIFGHEAPLNLAKALHLLGERVSYLPSPVAQRRLVGVSLMFLNLLVHKGRFDEAETDESFASALADTMEQIVMAMCLPLRIEPAGT